MFDLVIIYIFMDNQDNVPASTSVSTGLIMALGFAVIAGAGFLLIGPKQPASSITAPLSTNLVVPVGTLPVSPLPVKPCIDNGMGGCVPAPAKICNVYVADTFNHRVQEFNSSGAYLAQWGSQGSGNGQFNYPFGVATDSSGNVYVADTRNNRIQKFSNIGTYLAQWGITLYYQGNWYIATDPSGNVYETDDYSGNHVKKFSSNGALIIQWGSTGNGNGGLGSTHGVATDSSGNVYVADSSGHRIVKFTSNGTFILTFGWGVLDGQNKFEICTASQTCQQIGVAGFGNGQFNMPEGIATDSSGNVYVAGGYNDNRIQKFTSSGAYITQWGSQGSGNGQFNNYPQAIATDSSNYVYVSDTSNNRIQKFNSTGTYITQWGTRGNGNGQFDGTGGVAVYCK